MNKKAIRTMVYIALYAAMIIVLDFISNTISLFKMPEGGRLSLATVGFLLASYHLGWKKGAAVAVVAILLMGVTGSISYYGIVSLLLDYVLGYMAYGFASIFPWYTGIIITNAFRLLCSTLAGVWVWGSGFEASLSYNATYMIPTAIVDFIIVPLVAAKLLPMIGKKK
ncbi:MAG: energy-coupled thiamine transporter ThiT [Erysipelotrichaceae bacterium]|nr:energy-coupled thiamine transporter ThiT [Erysipelotrichaceae bacterium]